MPVITPTGTRDYQGAALLAAAVGAGVWALMGVIAIHTAEANISLSQLAHLYPKFMQLTALGKAATAIPAMTGTACAVWIFALLSKKNKAEFHGEGGQLKIGAGAASAAISAERKRSKSLFKVAGINFTIDRIRRSIVILGSIGGGKTQAIWSLLQGLQGSGYRLLIVDGPKGDYSCSVQGDPLIIAPWHSGPAWDIAKDCRTRGHARELARSLIPVSDKDPIWGNAAGMIFVAILCKLQAEQGVKWGWAEIYDHITLDIPSLHQIAAAYYPPAVQVLADAESKTTQSVVINLVAFMLDVYEMSLAWRDTGARFSFTDWWKGAGDRQTVILQGSGEFKTLAGGYISSIINVLANLTASPAFKESSTRKNALIIDEMAQLPRLGGVEKFLEIGRSKGCSAIFATQSPAQLRKIYGQDDLSSWFAMTGTKIFVRILGADDAEIALKELGKREVYLPTTSTTASGQGATAGQSVTQGWQREEVEVVRADQLKELGPCKTGIRAILEGFGKNPIQVIFPFIKTPAIREAFEENPAFNSYTYLTQQNEINMNSFVENGNKDDGNALESPSDFAQSSPLSAAVAAPEVETASMISDEIIMNSYPENAEIKDGPATEIEEKIIDTASDPITKIILGDAGGHLLELLQEVQEVTKTDCCNATNSVIQSGKKKKKIIKKESNDQVRQM